MKIIQYNIYFGEHPDISIDFRLTNICKCLISENADVICLQEVLQSKYLFMVSLLKNTYPYIYPDPLDGIQIPYDTIICSKFPIIKSQTIKYEDTSMGRNIKFVLIENKFNDLIYIATTHFESEYKNKCSKKINQYIRCAEILEQLYASTFIPIVLCIDTNICNISWKSYYQTFNYKKKWRDTWMEIKCKNNQNTFDSETNPILISRYNTSIPSEFQGINIHNTEKINHSSKYSSKYLLKSRLDRILHISDYYTYEFKLIGLGSQHILSDHYGVSCVFSKDKPDINNTEYREYTEYIEYTEQTNKKKYKKLF
jgi:endonuclease/exonuclease/phosphatase family metal-dependent hydrolase